jgi:succinate dehydrogenase/fumarate reductase flavoprotein subunit
MPVDELLENGFKLPFFADLPGMPELERKAIWGLMVGQEGKTKIPVLGAYTKAGFDPATDLLQSYGDGWKSGSFLPQERQLFGLPGGIVNDWELRTNLEGLYAAGDQLFASNCHGHAAATGHYAGRHASRYASQASLPEIELSQVKAEKERILSLVNRDSGLGWKELNAAIARIMQNYCGEAKSEELLVTGLKLLDNIMQEDASALQARNPHELVRCLEVLNIMDNAELVLNSCLARQASSKHLHFTRREFPEIDPPEWHKFITVKRESGKVVVGERALDYYGSLEDNYSAHNQDYQKGDDP